MNTTVASVIQNLGLVRTYLFDSYLPNAFTEIELEGGNTNLTGENGAGKTSTLNLIPIFYGARPDRLIDRAANKKSFVNYYLPHHRSMIVYEYHSPVGPCCVVLYRMPNQDTHCFRFVQGNAKQTIFSQEMIAFHKEHKNCKALFEELQKSGIYTSRQIDNSLDYVAVLTNEKSRLNKDLKLRDLAITFSLCGKGYEMKHIHALTQITMSKHNLLDNFKTMLVDAFLDQEDILGNRLNSLETQTLISNITTLRHLERENPRILEGSNFRSQLLVVYSKLLANKQFSQQQISEIQRNIDLIAFDRESFDAKAKLKRKEIDTNLSLVKADLFDANNRLNISQKELSTIEEQEIGYNKANIRQKRSDFKNLTHFKQLALDAKNDLEEINKNNSEISSRFEKLKNEENEKKDHRLKQIDTEIEVLTTQIDNLRDQKESQLQNIALAEKDNLDQFENTKAAERNQIDVKIDRFRAKIEEARKRTDQEQEQINEFELSISTQKQKITTKEDEITVSEKETRNLHKDKSDLSFEINSVTRKLASAEQEEVELRKILFETNTLLRFLNDSTDTVWKNNIAKVINPQLLLKKGLNPSWSPEQDPSTATFYGLELDLSKLDIPLEAESADELSARLKDCEAKVSEIKAQQVALNKQYKNVDDAIQDSERKTMRLRIDLRQLKEQLLSTESMFSKYVKQVNNEIEARIQVHKNELSSIQQQLQLFKNNINPERQLIRQHFDADRQNTYAQFEHQFNNLTQDKNSYLQQKQSVITQFQEKVNMLISMRDSELQQRGVDVAVVKAAESRFHQATNRFRVIEGYAKEVAQYDHWCQYDLKRKDGLVKAISLSQEDIFKLNQSLQKLKQELEVCTEYYYSEIGKFDAAEKECKRQIIALDNLGKRIDNVLDGIPGVEPGQPQSKLTFDVLVRDIEDNLNEQERLEKELRQALHKIIFILQKNTGFELYKRWQDRMDKLGAISEAARSLYSMQEIEKLVLQELQVQAEFIVNEFNLSAIILKNYAQALNSFKRKLNSTSKKLTEQTNKNNPFPALQDIQINLLSVMDNESNQGKKTVYDQIAQYLKDLEETQFTDLGVSKLPSEKIVSSFEATLNAIKNLNIKTDELYSLVKLNIKYKENNRSVDVKNDSDLVSGSSEGLSRLIVIIIFTALTRQLCPNKDVVIHIPLDEISQFDSQNTTRLFELMEFFNINLLCAQPNLSIELSKHFKHKHDVDRNFGIRKFQAARNNKPNPLLY